MQAGVRFCSVKPVAAAIFGYSSSSPQAALPVARSQAAFGSFSTSGQWTSLSPVISPGRHSGSAGGLASAAGQGQQAVSSLGAGRVFSPPRSRRRYYCCRAAQQRGGSALLLSSLLLLPAVCCFPAPLLMMGDGMSGVWCCDQLLRRCCALRGSALLCS